MLATYAAIASVPRVHDDYRPVRHVKIRVYVSVGGEPDPDNLLKYTLDGLKRARLIVNDNWQWCRFDQPFVARCSGKKNERTEIDIADLVHVDKVPKIAARILVVKAYPDLATCKPLPERNVYLMHTGSGDDAGARTCDMFETDKPLPSVRELAEWAASVGIPVVQEPPGCLEPGFVWPPDGWGGIKAVTSKAAPVYVPDANIF